MINFIQKKLMNLMPPESHEDTGFYFNDASSLNHHQFGPIKMATIHDQKCNFTKNAQF